MKLIQWTLFLDMLGYGELNGQIDSDDKANEFIAFMKKNAQIFDSQNNKEMREGYQDSNFDLYKYYDVQHALVSDSLIITYKPREFDEKINEKLYYLHSANALFIITLRLQEYLYHCLEVKKMFVRGGISIKYSKIDNNFAVGLGIIEAYNIESKIAKYPRIVFSSEILENKNLIEAIEFLSELLYKIPSIISRDNDIAYLDYAKIMVRLGLQGGLNLENMAIYHNFFTNQKNAILFHIDLILKKVKKYRDEGRVEESSKIIENVLSKYKWLKDYHNTSIKTFEDDKIEKMYMIID